MSTTFDLSREIDAAKIIRAQIADLMNGEDADPDLIRDMVEGETNIREILTAMIVNEAADLELLAGVKDRAESLKKRKDRIERRIDTRRALMLTAMQMAEIQKHETPDGTLSRRKTPAACIVTEEADIPAKFWEPQPPKLSKRAVLEALKAGEAVPGASLSNGGETISIR